MAVEKVSLSIDADVLAQAREQAGPRELSALVTEALRRQLQHDRIVEFLAEAEARSGPIPEELVDEAMKLWQEPDVAAR